MGRFVRFAKYTGSRPPGLSPRSLPRPVSLGHGAHGDAQPGLASQTIFSSRVFLHGVIGYRSSMGMTSSGFCYAAPVTIFATMLMSCTRPVAPPMATAGVDRLMTPEELAAVPSRAPDHRIAYGSDPSQYAELRVPEGSGPHPLVVLIHGGCFKAAYATAQYFGAMADALKEDRIATWNIEYRRLGQTGGGWPGTYLDVGQAVDHVRAIASDTTSISAASPLSGTRPADIWRCGRRHAVASRRQVNCTSQIHFRYAGSWTWLDRST